MSSNQTDISTSQEWPSPLNASNSLKGIPQLDSRVSQLADEIFGNHVHAMGGVLLSANKVLDIASEHPILLEWADGACRVQIGDIGETRRAMPNAYFRALLARLSTLFSEASSTPGDWNFYLGQGALPRKIANSTEPIVEMTFENTQQRQFAQLRAI